MRTKIALLLLATLPLGCSALDGKSEDEQDPAKLQPKLASIETVQKFCLFMVAGREQLNSDPFFGSIPGNSSLTACIHEANRMQLPLGIGEVPETGDSLTGRFDLAHRLECASTSSDFESFKRCITYDRADFCQGKASHRHYCDGKLLVQCGGHVSSVVDCGVGGMGCWADEVMDKGHCVKEGELCPERPAEVASQRLCRDNWVMSCVKAGDPMQALGHCREGETCKSYGLVHGTEVAVCSAEPTCTKDTCDGNTLVRCEEVQFGDGNPGFNPYRADCTSIGQVCDPGFNRPNCVDEATECTLAFTDACDGNSIKTCSAGKVVTIPCSSIGFSTCEQSVRGVSICK